MGNVLGLVFANMHDATVSDLTKNRTMGSILFGGRYRLIDFALSNMVNSGISDVGVITKSNYQSLLDHLGVSMLFFRTVILLQIWTSSLLLISTLKAVRILQWLQPPEFSLLKKHRTVQLSQ